MAIQTTNIEECIENCLDCSRICYETAMTHCLSLGGKHTEPEHFKLIINCSEICETSAKLMLANSNLHRAICRACAEVCKQCAESCEELGDMQQCVDICQRCAESCEQMAVA